MKTMSSNTFLKAIQELNYTVNASQSFHYTNNLNPGNPVKARSVRIIEADTKRSYANVNARRDANFEALQNLRKNHVVKKGDIIWEI